MLAVTAVQSTEINVSVAVCEFLVVAPIVCGFHVNSCVSLYSFLVWQSSRCERESWLLSLLHIAVCLFELMFYIAVNNFSFMSG